MGPLGWQETVFIFLLALLIFGPKKLPELGRTIGKAMTEFRRASSDLKSTFDREMHAIERENEELKETTQQYANTIYQGQDDYSYDSGAYGDSHSYGSGDTPAVTASTSSAPSATTDSASAPQGAAVGTVTPSENGTLSLHEASPARVSLDKGATQNG